MAGALALPTHISAENQEALINVCPGVGFVQKCAQFWGQKGEFAQHQSSDQRTRWKQESLCKPSMYNSMKADQGHAKDNSTASKKARSKQAKKLRSLNKRSNCAPGGRASSDANASHDRPVGPNAAMAQQDTMHARELWEQQFPALSTSCGRCSGAGHLHCSRFHDNGQSTWETNCAAAAKEPATITKPKNRITAACRHVSLAAEDGHDLQHCQVVPTRRTSGFAKSTTSEVNKAHATLGRSVHHPVHPGQEDPHLPSSTKPRCSLSSRRHSCCTGVSSANISDMPPGHGMDDSCPAEKDSMLMRSPMAADVTVDNGSHSQLERRSGKESRAQLEEQDGQHCAAIGCTGKDHVCKL